MMRMTTLAALAAAVLSSAASFAQSGSQGLTTPQVLAPFDPAAPACSSPTGLTKSLAFARDNSRDFMSGIEFGLSKAAADHGLSFQSSDADNDQSNLTATLTSLLSNKVGAVVVAPVDARATAPHLQHLIWSGAYVATIVPPPATTILNAPQYLTGKVLGDAAAEYINTTFDGQANVVILTHDSLEFLTPRFAAMRDSLRLVPGAVIVADISPLSVDEAGGYEMMKTILLAEPKIDVVLGADTVVLGALKAMRDAGLARPDQFFGGIDGETAAVAELKLTDSPYKASVSLASSVFGYALGVQAANWLDGKSVPQAIDVLPYALTRESLSAYEADQADPGAVWTDPERQARYLKLYGNICPDTRDTYLNFPWSSERE